MMAAAQGLPPAARLRQRNDFAAMRHAKGRQRGTWFMFRHAPSRVEHARLGMAVSRKVSTRAVERNRIKRQIRESFRQHRLSLPPLDILVIAHHAAAGQSSPSLREELDSLFSRLAR